MRKWLRQASLHARSRLRSAFSPWVKARAVTSGPAGRAYLMPTTIESGPSRCSARVSVNPASRIQPMQSATV